MKKLISVLAITAALSSCGKNIQSNGKSDSGLSVSGSKGISKLYQKSENLIHLIKDKSLNMVKTSLTAGADPNYLSFKGERPLVVAAQIGVPEIISELFRYGADPALADSKDQYPLFETIKHNHLGAFKLILSHVKNIDELNSNQESALIMALRKSNENMANTLIKEGANIFFKDSNGRAPLEIARVNNLQKSIKLLSNVAKIQAKGINGQTVINTLKESSTDTLEYIINRYQIKELVAGSNALNVALNTKDITARSLLLKKLLDSGLSANGEESDTIIPVIAAIKLNDMGSLELLLQKGADVNKQDEMGLTALVYAVRDLNTSLVDKLLNFGAEVEYEANYLEQTFIRSACSFVPRYFRMRSDSKTQAKLIKSKLDC